MRQGDSLSTSQEGKPDPSSQNPGTRPSCSVPRAWDGPTPQATLAFKTGEGYRGPRLEIWGRGVEPDSEGPCGEAGRGRGPKLSLAGCWVHWEWREKLGRIWITVVVGGLGTLGLGEGPGPAQGGQT